MSTTPHRNLTSDTDTDDHANHVRRSKDTSAPQPEKKFLDLSLTQVVGGSLAAATAAALGSTLGVAGTIVGAAFISILSAVGAALYTQSLRRTRDGVLSAVSVVKEKVSVNGVDTTRTDLQVVEPAMPGSETVIHDVIMETDANADAPGETERTTTTVTPVRRRTLSPRLVLASAAAVFALTMAGIFGFELITGKSLSGGEGTTIQQVTGGGGGGGEPSDSAPTDDGTSEDIDKGADPSATPSDPTESSASPTSAEPSSSAPSSSASESSTPSSTPSSPSPTSAPETTEPPAAVDPVEPNAAG